MKIISGQFVPKDLPKRRDIIFLGEKPSLYFVRHPNERNRGNYNSTTTDFIFHNFIRKYFKKAVYVTDLVKTEGRAGTRLREWDKNPIFRKIILKELGSIKPKLIVVLSRKVERIFTSDPLLIKYKKQVRSIYHPSYVSRYQKYGAWDSQFSSLIKGLKAKR